MRSKPLIGLCTLVLLLSSVVLAEKVLVSTGKEEYTIGESVKILLHLEEEHAYKLLLRHKGGRLQYRGELTPEITYTPTRHTPATCRYQYSYSSMDAGECATADDTIIRNTVPPQGS